MSESKRTEAKRKASNLASSNKVHESIASRGATVTEMSAVVLRSKHAKEISDLIQAHDEPNSVEFTSMKAAPRLRDIELRPDGLDIKVNQHRHHTGSMLYMKGTIAEVPCRRCASGYNPFVQCVVHKGKMGGACAGCCFTGKGNRCQMLATTPVHANTRAEASDNDVSLPQEISKSSHPSPNAVEPEPVNHIATTPVHANTRTEVGDNDVSLPQETSKSSLPSPGAVEPKSVKHKVGIANDDSLPEPTVKKPRLSRRDKDWTKGLMKIGKNIKEAEIIHERLSHHLEVQEALKGGMEIQVRDLTVCITKMIEGYERVKEAMDQCNP